MRHNERNEYWKTAIGLNNGYDVNGFPAGYVQMSLMQFCGCSTPAEFVE
jgi:hypothetical protein